MIIDNDGVVYEGVTVPGVDLRHHKELLWVGIVWCAAWIVALVAGVYWLAALIVVVGIVALGLWSTLGPQIKERLERAGSIRQARVQDRPPSPQEALSLKAPPTELPPAEAPTIEVPTDEVSPVEEDRLEFEYRFALVGADMQGALLAGVDLQQVDMRGADLQGADLRDANLWRIDLLGANLREANLNRADLRWARLARSNLTGASLRAANLRGADLRDAEIAGADLRGANLWDAMLGAQYEEARLDPDKPGKRISEEVARAVEAQLAQVRALRGAIMPDGSRYDGRFDLEGDVLGAQQQGIDLNDPAARAAFYGVAEGEAPDVPFRVVPEGAHDPAAPVWRIALLPVDKPQDTMELELHGDAVLGRGSMADINLQPYGGPELGISRQHARICPGQAALTVVDLDSTNGTWHNGVLLRSGVQCALTDGDVVALGRLRFRVRIVGRPTGEA
jgi:uncharacterized protein YjbI with pentapeptide repeats